MPTVAILLHVAMHSNVYSIYELTLRYRACICRELVMTINIPIQEKNTTCRIVASAKSLSMLLVIEYLW